MRGHNIHGRTNKQERSMAPIKRILVAVKTSDRRSRRGVQKAIQIAKQLGASVELFHAISDPVFVDFKPLGDRSIAQIRRETLQLAKERLEKLAAGARKAGVETSCHVSWDFPPHEAIVRRSNTIRADLVIAECHEGRRLAPWLM